MKPTFPSNIRRAPRLPKTDYNFQAPFNANLGGRCFGSHQPSFRAISQDYFEGEARHSFAGEAALFTAIVLIVAVPLLQSASALVHLVRSSGVL